MSKMEEDKEMTLSAMEETKRTDSDHKKDDDDPLVGQIVGKSKYIVVRYLAGGSFGRVYLGYHTDTKKRVVIKMEKMSTDKPQLQLEYGFYRQLGTYRAIPKIWYFGPCSSWNALVMERLGPSLEEMFRRCESQFSLKTVVQLAVQMVNLMEYIHHKGILYRDTKPENFLLGLPNSPKWFLVHVIDMGLCKYWRQIDGRHIPFTDGKYLTGTVRYMSVNNHLGNEQSRRDDLEAVGYMLIYFYKGRLPWQGIEANTQVEKYHKIGHCKMNTPVNTLCDQMPEEFSEFMNACKNYDFEEEPDYRRLVRNFIELLGKLGFEMDDKVYDWNRHQQSKPHHLRFAELGKVRMVRKLKTDPGMNNVAT